MTVPPQPGNWGPPPPYGPGQPPNGPAGQWLPPQQTWGHPPQQPKSNSLKWLLIGVAVLLVIAISVGATLLFTRDGGDGNPPTATGTSAPNGEVASANDTGPVSVITEDPTCEPWRPINDTLVDAQRKGWSDRDFTIPATSWSPEQRKIHEDIASAMRDAANQMVRLAEITPHRIMRELYEQTIAYRRAYADSIPTYTLKDNSLVVTASNTTGAITALCAAIENRSAATRGHLVSPSVTPTEFASIGDPATPNRFLGPPGDEVCKNWTESLKRFENSTSSWRTLDNKIPANQWTPEQRATMDATKSAMIDYVNIIDELSADTPNLVVKDFGALSAQYFKAYALAIPTYTAADSYLSSVALYATLAVFNACAAVATE